MADRDLPQTETDLSPVIAELLRTTVVRSDRVAGSRTGALRRVELGDGRVIGVKRYALGRRYATEGAALRELAGAVPVPEILCTLDGAIAYRWIDGVTLEDCRLRAPAAFARLAMPLGQLLGALARHAGALGAPGSSATVDLAPVLSQLAGGAARAQLGGELADALADALTDAFGGQREAEPGGDATHFVHGDLGTREVIVAPALDRIAGVVGWEAATRGPVLHDVGSLLRHASVDAAFAADFERGHGALPDGWLARARLHDAARLVAALAGGESAVDPLELRAVVARSIAATAATRDHAGGRHAADAGS